MKLIFFVRL